MELQELLDELFGILRDTWLMMAIRFVSTAVTIYRARTFSLLEILPHAYVSCDTKLLNLVTVTKK